MGAYLIGILVIFILYGILEFKKVEKNYKINVILIASGVVMILISGLRYKLVGTDTVNYLNFYKHVGTVPFVEIFGLWMEEGFSLWSRIIYAITKSDTIYLFLNSAVIIVGFIYFISKNSKNKLFSLYLFLSLMFYFTSMNIIRQFIAIVIVYVSLEFLYKNKNKHFFVGILIAMLFHKSAIINIGFFIVRNKKLDIKKMLIIFGSLFLLVKLNIIETVISYTSFGHYEGTKFFEKGSSLHFIVYGAILAFIVAIDYLIKIGKIKGKLLDGEYKEITKLENLMRESIILWGLFMAVVTQLLSTNIEIISRLSMYFMPFAIIAIPNALSKIEDKKIRRILYCLITIATLGYAVLYVLKGGQGTMDYSFFWSH